MAPSDSTATRQNSIVDARNEVATANGRASFAHATALVAEIRLRDAKIESLERSNQELITLRDSLLAMTDDRSAVPLHDVSVQAKLTRLENLELMTVQQEQELATLQSKYSEALNYLGDCLETIDNLNDDMAALRALVKEQSELVAAAREPKPVCMSRTKSTTLRQLSCDSAFEWPVGKDIEGGSESDDVRSVDEPVTPIKHAELIDKLTIQHKATAVLVAAAASGGSKKTIYRNSCLLPWVF